MNGKESYHHGNLRTALLESALAILLESGTEELSLRSVARRAGVSPSAPYNHFKDKQALLCELANNMRTQASHIFLVALEREETPRAKLKALGEACVCYALEHKAEYNLMFGGSFSTYIEGEPQDSTLNERLREIIQTANGSLSAAELDTAEIIVWSLIHGLSQLLIGGSLGGARQDPQSVDTLINQVMDRLGRLLELEP